MKNKVIKRVFALLGAMIVLAATLAVPIFADDIDLDMTETEGRFVLLWQENQELEESFAWVTLTPNSKIFRCPNSKMTLYTASYDTNTRTYTYTYHSEYSGLIEIINGEDQIAFDESQRELTYTTFYHKDTAILNFNCKRYQQGMEYVYYEDEFRLVSDNTQIHKIVIEFSIDGGGASLSMQQLLCDVGFGLYTKESYDLFLEQGYNSGYEAGKTDGYSSGYQAGYDEGENEGYSYGLNEGNEQGYQAGFADGEVAGYDDGYDMGYSSGYVDGETDGYGPAYQQGYDIGFADGENEGFTEGYDQGYAEGEKYAWDSGYGAGQADMAETTSAFKEFVFAIFDAPVTLIDGMLNFDIFGINLAGLVKTIVTMAVVAVIVFAILKFSKG